jgi:hypothetical protein
VPHLFLAPVVVGGGKQSLPDDVRLDLELANAVSATAWFTSATARGREEGVARRTLGPYAASAASAGSSSASSRGSRREITFVIPPSLMLTP